MVFDECLAHPATLDAARASMTRTVRRARRARERLLQLRAAPVVGVTVCNPGQAQFGIVQGGVFPELREESGTKPWRSTSRPTPWAALASASPST